MKRKPRLIAGSAYYKSLSNGPVRHDEWLLLRGNESFSALPQDVRELLADGMSLLPPSLAAEKRAYKSFPDLFEKLNGMLHLQQLKEVDFIPDTPPQVKKTGRHRIVEEKYKKDSLPDLKSLKSSTKALEWANNAAQITATPEFVISALEDTELFVERWDAVLLHYIRAERAVCARSLRSQQSIRPYGLNVVVIGGGPCGIFSSILAALQGHHVQLVELRACPLRRRNIGLFPQDTITLARLGAPIELFNNTLYWCEKAGVTLFDLEEFLFATALKLGVTIYRNAEAMNDIEYLSRGIVVLKRRPGSKSTVALPGVDTKNLLCCKHGTTLASKVDEIALNFDLLVIAEGTKQRFTSTMVGEENIASVNQIAAKELLKHPEQSHYTDKEDHIKQVINDTDWKAFHEAASHFRNGENDSSYAGVALSNVVSSFVCNMPRSIFKLDKPVPNWIATCPTDWIAIPLPAARDFSDSESCLKNLYDYSSDITTASSLASAFGCKEESIFRVHFEGMWPSKFDGEDIWDIIGKKTPKEILMAMFAACDIAEFVDENQLDEYLELENGWKNSAQNACVSFKGELAGLMGRDDGKPCICGNVPNSDPEDNLQYFIVGDAMLHAWFRWGIGVADGFRSVRTFGKYLESGDAAFKEVLALKLEAKARKRAVQTAAYFFHFDDVLEKDPRMRSILQHLTNSK